MTKPSSNRMYILRDDGVLVLVTSPSQVTRNYEPYLDFKINSATCVHVVGNDGNIHPKRHGYKLKPGEHYFKPQKGDAVYMRIR